MAIFGILVLFIYAGGNLYVFLRGWQFLNSIFPTANKKIYLTIMILISLLYVVGMIFFRDKNTVVSKMIIQAGSLWLVILLYSFLILFTIDILRMIFSWIPQINSFLQANSKTIVLFFGVGTVLTIICLLIFGTYFERNTRFTNYDISIKKKVEEVKNLKVIFFSDVHLGNIIGKERIAKMVELINSQAPDIVLLGGDIIEGDYGPFENGKMGEEIKKIKSKYGIYGILGNHEYFGRDVQRNISLLKESGVKMLVDEVVLVENKFYLVGRDDKMAERFLASGRKSLNKILEGVDNSKPVILLDHQPSSLEEAVKNRVDLQLSGHTHNGQLWPVNYITGLIYENDWGYLKKNDTHIIVSCGAGTWGPPFRVGSYSEIVSLNVEFE